MSSKLLVNEVFGPTLQGEGPSIGTPCAFLRVAVCNLRCVWCDTFYTWDWSKVSKDDEIHPMSVDEVTEAVNKVLPRSISPLLVVSGGEPMLQQKQLIEVMQALSPMVDYEIETAGTVVPIDELLEQNVLFNVSPKLAHSGNTKAKRYKPDVLEALQATGLVQAWKFVAQQPSDLDEVHDLVTKHRLFPVFIMPEGVNAETVAEHTKSILPEVISRGWRLTPRLHISVWGTERGH